MGADGGRAVDGESGRQTGSGRWERTVAGQWTVGADGGRAVDGGSGRQTGSGRWGRTVAGQWTLGADGGRAGDGGRCEDRVQLTGKQTPGN